MRSLALLSLLLLVGCSTRQAVSTDETSPVAETAANTEPFGSMREAMKEEYGLEMSPFTLLEARVDGDSLRTRVQYGGGFREHRFQIFPAGPATKSLPRQQPVLFMHYSDGDMGRALITEDRSFDLKAFRDPVHPVVMIRLEFWPELLEYHYTN